MQYRTYFIQDPNTRFALAGAKVTIYQNRTTTPVTVYAPGTGSALTQPLTADSAGKISFGAPDGLYTVKATGSGATLTVDDQEFFDYATNKSQVVALSAQIQAVLGNLTDLQAMGAVGAGMGVCANLPDGFAPLAGTTALGSDDFANYRYRDGSIMCWNPVGIYRIGDARNPTYPVYGANSVQILPLSAYSSVAAANAAGFAVHRAFYDGGVIKPGFFFDKYGCSNNGGIASSIRLGGPLSTAADHSPLSGLVNTPANAYAGCVDAAKSRGPDVHCAMLYQYKWLALVALAHGQAATSAANCAWYDAAGNTNFPKGNNNNAFGDVNDSSVTFTSDGYTASGATSALCGSGTPFAKTTHNGQSCGIADLNGNLYGVALGLTSDGSSYYALNTAVAAKSITSGSSTATDAWGSAGLAAMYTNIGATYGAAKNTSASLKVGGSGQVFDPSASGNAWLMTGMGIPLLADANGTNLFGIDLFTDFRPNQMCPCSGANWDGGSRAGVWALALNGNRGASGSNVGFRAALYP